MTNLATVLVYGRPDCPDTQLARRVLSEHGVNYQWYDTGLSSRRREEAISVNGGSTKVPTVVLPNGLVMVEPRESELLSALRDAGLVQSEPIPEGTPRVGDLMADKGYGSVR